ncbi:ATP-binding cassette domain-containing protein [Bradyrhizobium sp. ISRA443]|uniref:ABC transporter ATP-binding protein n=1 Tax=unclassified Bradyrhizobium TaxID=2631580 RepID=UPI00247AA2D9|nr:MULTISPECIES: oligopeptide/dipeptide ABC transporter ATP-binding protein [unclassified Bradyrhizobium]WGR95893.1 ATP-binding cassette domain-containing protein [Bradyrhizobium sp. ISRA435]WGS02855.1 ATP-binding cassette domain-containing protein [Bradyrhizobium sp. ISRA436]WGS09742.1 ATP-binding cassette domain-containing protein [Bradyrhizobium sp. ISRA437]WGS16624.1 ATP-binding cassette domain-containing protein [Bradyrhizobium sp. ISRA443]
MLDQPPSARETPLLEVKDLVQRYTLPRERLFKPAAQVRALNGVTAQVTAGKSLGVVGESGSGKSTFARLVMALERPTSGQVSLLGRDLNRMAANELRHARRDFQMVFQDPYGSLDPRQTTARIVAEPLTALGRIDRGSLRERVATALRQVGLRDADMDKFPHEFSGGQRQRIAIARALITQPKLIVADEPVSALDVSVQAQVLNLMQDLQDEFGLSYILISHDLAVVDLLCDEIAVMYLGRIVEQGSPEDLFAHSAHPYTRALLEAVPRARAGGVRRRRGAQAIASQSSGSEGCPYASRCVLADQHCRETAPALRTVGQAHQAACHHAEAVMALPPAAAEAGAG